MIERGFEVVRKDGKFYLMRQNFRMDGYQLVAEIVTTDEPPKDNFLVKRGDHFFNSRYEGENWTLSLMFGNDDQNVLRVDGKQVTIPWHTALTFIHNEGTIG